MTDDNQLPPIEKAARPSLSMGMFPGTNHAPWRGLIVLVIIISGRDLFRPMLSSTLRTPLIWSWAPFSPPVRTDFYSAQTIWIRILLAQYPVRGTG